MVQASLFSGLGGFDLAADWKGWENAFHCEIDSFCRRVLKFYWPHAESFKDVLTTDFTKYADKIDVLTGGFPCQPWSVSGKRKGSEDERHLWPENLRAIREIRPRYYVGENVSGLINWNAGMVFDQIQADLETEGYEVVPVILPSCSVNAPHRRDRVWFIAHRNSTPTKYTIQTGRNLPTSGGGKGIITNTDGQRLWRQAHGFGKSGFINQNGAESFWENFPTQSPICGRNDGLPSKLDGITFSKWRNQSIKGYGNAIVPHVAFKIFTVIEEIEALGSYYE